MCPYILNDSKNCRAQDPIYFDADPDPGSALKKMDPDPKEDFSNYFAYFFYLLLCNNLIKQMNHLEIRTFSIISLYSTIQI